MSNGAISVDWSNEKDIISQLPDDILVSIIARLPIKLAMRTSVLSKRWMNLYKFVSDIDLRCHELAPVCVPPHGSDSEEIIQGPVPPHGSNSEEIIHGLESFLRLYSGSKIHSFSLTCCLTIPYTERFEQCIYSLEKLGVEKLELYCSCSCGTINALSFSLHLLSEMPSLKYLLLRSCCLQPNLKSQCNSLRTLELWWARVSPGSVECILSNCLRLQSLFIGQCACPSKLCFHGPNLPLKSLIIDDCGGVEEIEIYASNLVVFEFKNMRMVNFMFDHAPQLQTICLLFYGQQNIMSHVLGKLAKDLPHVKSLIFDFKGDFYQESRRLMRIGVQAFSNLRQLELSFYRTPETNLPALIPFLQSCALLQEFQLNCSLELDGADEYDGAQPIQPAALHSELKKVQISGFSGTENEMEFALYILRSAVSLEQMDISRCAKYYEGCGWWSSLTEIPWSEETLEMIQKQLQGQALSKTAQVIIQYESSYSYSEKWLELFT